MVELYLEFYRVFNKTQSLYNPIFIKEFDLTKFLLDYPMAPSPLRREPPKLASSLRGTPAAELPPGGSRDNGASSLRGTLAPPAVPRAKRYTQNPCHPERRATKGKKTDNGHDPKGEKNHPLRHARSRTRSAPKAGSNKCGEATLSPNRSKSKIIPLSHPKDGQSFELRKIEYKL